MIHNPRRLHPEVETALESWSVADWKRRTGYVLRGETLRIQLREGCGPGDSGPGERELDFYDFGKEYGFSWLNKPCWR